MKHLAGIVLVGCLSASQVAHADLLGALKSLNNALAGAANGGAGAAGSPVAGNGFGASTLVMSDEDKAAIAKKIQLAETLRANHGILAKDIKEAADQIEPAVELAATATTNLCSLEQRYARPGNFNCPFYSSVFWYMQNTPRTQPLQVVSISNWALQTANAFQFYVNYCSDISQVCHSVGYVFSNMGDGWMLGAMSPY
ncbi:MAG: hypothetical protein M0T84_15560 [Betaproteobacteria bacterium]|nr:hypothetical protein [Betaproteobacteria bacterium]